MLRVALRLHSGEVMSLGTGVATGNRFVIHQGGFAMEEPLRRGEPVALSQAATDTLGHIVAMSADGKSAEVAWHRRPGYEHRTTMEPTEVLRRVHESEMSP